MLVCNTGICEDSREEVCDKLEAQLSTSLYGRVKVTYTVASELTVHAHEDESDKTPACVGGVDELPVVPEGFYLANFDHLLELAQLQLNERVRRLAVRRVILDHNGACVLDPAAGDEPSR